jgi:hypothetical protein
MGEAHWTATAWAGEDATIFLSRDPRSGRYTAMWCLDHAPQFTRVVLAATGYEEALAEALAEAALLWPDARWWPANDEHERPCDVVAVGTIRH